MAGQAVVPLASQVQVPSLELFAGRAHTTGLFVLPQEAKVSAAINNRANVTTSFAGCWSALFGISSPRNKNQKTKIRKRRSRRSTDK